jgi:putative peptidoglycan lipid II flippase
MSRVMFPYIAFIAVFALHQGTLNANNIWGSPASAPAAANVCMIAFLGFAAFFPKVSPGVASMASWGFLASGLAQLAIVMADARRHGLLERLTWPRLTPEIRQFFWMLGPAIGISASYQIGALADQIVGSLLPTGGLSAISYADRLYQLPGGVIIIAAGSVLLREMSALVARGDEQAALVAQNRAASLTLALGAPFVVVFLLIPDLVIAVAFEHGAFKADATRQAAGVLAAYAFGMPALFVDRITAASFLARGDTATPMKVTLIGVAVNVALKMALYRPLGAPGLALATAAGLWIKVAGVFALARRRGWTAPDQRLLASVAATLFASGALALALTLADGPLVALMEHLPRFAREARLAALTAVGVAVYFPALGAGLRLTHAVPASLLKRALSALRLAR